MKSTRALDGDGIVQSRLRKRKKKNETEELVVHGDER